MDRTPENPFLPANPPPVDMDRLNRHLAAGEDLATVYPAGDLFIKALVFEIYAAYDQLEEQRRGGRIHR